MIIYPAIDLRGGKVVRLREGDPDRETIFSDNPVQVARHWVEQGANWLHMVNLDGAFQEDNNHLSILEEVAKLDVNIQFGGGLRQLEDIQRVLESGAKRVVLGTLAIQQPDIVTQIVQTFGADALCVALDARDGRITTHGWTEVSDETPVAFGRAMAKRGVVHALYTDIKRDGSLIGVNVEETISLARQTGLQVIASGGVSDMTQIIRLAHSKVVAGAIIGMALYKEDITLQEALIAASMEA